jgi:hypothetical protein
MSVAAGHASAGHSSGHSAAHASTVHATAVTHEATTSHGNNSQVNFLLVPHSSASSTGSTVGASNPSQEKEDLQMNNPSPAGAAAILGLAILLAIVVCWGLDKTSKK